MCGKDPKYTPLQPGQWLPDQIKCGEPANDWDQWDEFDPGPLEGYLWDAFELDDEMVEPEPEYGDFWGELDEEEAI